MNLSFGAFHFGVNGPRRDAGPGGVRALHAMLRQSKRAERELQQYDAATVAEKREDQRWSRTINRAQGTKVLDDTKRISRALQKRRAKKRKSAKQWAARKKQLLASVDEAAKSKMDGSSKKNGAKKRKGSEKGAGGPGDRRTKKGGKAGAQGADRGAGRKSRAAPAGVKGKDKKDRNWKPKKAAFKTFK